jgi:hypothetical protein
VLGYSSDHAFDIIHGLITGHIEHRQQPDQKERS